MSRSSIFKFATGLFTNQFNSVRSLLGTATTTSGLSTEEAVRENDRKERENNERFNTNNDIIVNTVGIDTRNGSPVNPDKSLVHQHPARIGGRNRVVTENQIELYQVPNEEYHVVIANDHKQKEEEKMNNTKIPSHDPRNHTTATQATMMSGNNKGVTLE